ncbi:CooT family nickel-binding protein [Fusobacteria bacterium ZRK30]|uniref:CooT family nickel-binding protein n=1 Tax=Psychrilyobacter atlanticus TaxID=271091 RepID=UPI0004115140|nr:CooT family nickel-binding protein [Psychrilyobacter atlanticus]UUV18634.1 CooT family nickel-binding protein [Fusobacteria bacterium ZRK30]
MKLFFKNLNETKVVMENMVSFKKENGAFIVKNFKGKEKVIAGKVIEMTNSKLVIEGNAVRETYRLAPLNF